MEENNFEFNNNETTPGEPVEPEVPQEPVESEVPQEPVAPQEPVQPTTPSEPVMPVEPSATSTIPVQPTPAPVQPTPVPEAPKKGGLGIVFIIIVVILLILIIGLVAVLVIVGLNKGGSNETSTTTTATVTETTSRYTVTTEANTTTIARTTREVDSPTPTSVDGDTIKIGSYSAKLPYGYSLFTSGGSTIIFNQTKQVQLAFGYNGSSNYDYLVAHENEVYKIFQQKGYTVEDAAIGTKNGHNYFLLKLYNPYNPSYVETIYGFTDLGSGVIEFQAMYDASKTTMATALDDADYIIGQVKTSAGSFAPGDVVEDPMSPDSFDNFDARLFENN